MSRVTAVRGVNECIAARVRDLRTGQRLSLDSLANRSGVSRSMISLIERAETSATAAVLEKIAAALNVSLASLFDPPVGSASESDRQVSRRQEQTVWQDPASGYSRRNVSPAAALLFSQIVEVQFPSGARVSFDSATRDAPLNQQVWILEGALEVTVGKDRHRLAAGDCLSMRIEGPTMFRNPTRKPTRYAVVISSEPAARR